MEKVTRRRIFFTQNQEGGDLDIDKDINLLVWNLNKFIRYENQPQK